MPLIDEAIQNVQKALDDLKATLIQEEILIQDVDSGELVNNQNPEAVAAYNARKWADVRF